jgi:hypothetical protein
MGKALVLVGLIAASIAMALAQEPPSQKPFTETVEVRVRTVLVFITDAKGKPLAKAPTPADLRVIEDGKPAEVVAVEPARRAGASLAKAEAAPAPATVSENPIASPASASRIPQYLYVDTTSLQQRSVPRIAATVEKDLSALLANGPLEIVVADPEPKVLLASTSGESALRGALERLPSVAVGKQRLYEARKDSVNQMLQLQSNPGNSVAMSTFRADVRGAIRQEMLLLQDSLRRLDAWSATLPYDRATVVYLCNDGFDSDLTEVYRNILMGSTRDEDKQMAMQLQQEFGREAADFTARAADVLAGRGATAVVLAFGGMDAEFGNSAANFDKFSSAAIRAPLSPTAGSYFARPNEPLLAVADKTGGRVVTAENKLPQAIDEVGGAYLVSFRSHVPSDGAPHPLEITAADAGLKVRAPRSVLAATTQTASAGKAVRALSAPPPATAESARSTGSLPVTASIVPVEKLGNGRIKGALTVSADFESIVEALERTGGGRVRVTVAVENSKGAPFTQSEETELDHSGGGTLWYYEANIVWPPEATRVAVTVEELATGTSGSAVAELPKP